jgi:ATP citrate (pro-S)-lyase
MLFSIAFLTCHIHNESAPFLDLDFSFIEMNPFTMVNGEPYPLDMRGELDDTAAFKNFKK